MNKNNLEKTTSGLGLSHELIAQAEKNIGLFFYSFAIQYFVQKGVLKNKLESVEFLDVYGDEITCASQRVFVKNIILTKDFYKVVEELEMIFLSSGKSKELPHDWFLARINKGFLIRQIFNQSNEVLNKFKFIDEVAKKDVREIDFKDLLKKMFSLTVEQQILVLSNIFSKLTDQLDDKKKTIILSFKENIQRIEEKMKKNPEKFEELEKENFNLLKGKFNL